MENNTIFYLINGIYGGGAERMMTWLANMSLEHGHDVTFVLTNQRIDDVRASTLNQKIRLISLADGVSGQENKARRTSIEDIIYRIDKKLKIRPQDFVIHRRFVLDNQQKIDKFKLLLSDKPDAVIVAFLDYSIALALLTAEKLPNRLIISERGDPKQHDNSLSASYFIRRRYCRANAVVFQTQSAKAYFSGEIQSKGHVIPNPVRDGLPEPFHGSREKVVVNFCRFSPEKNLPLLVRAFGMFWQEHRDYELHIIGDSAGAYDLIAEIWKIAGQYGVAEHVKLIPFMENVHEVIRTYSMFVSSSDNEGMSNSMLEAMAMGLPCICTDCPSYGARQVITDAVSGLLVEVGNEHQMADAMSRIADDASFAAKLSNEACKIRESHSSKRIFHAWNNLLAQSI